MTFSPPSLSTFSYKGVYPGGDDGVKILANPSTSSPTTSDNNDTKTNSSSNEEEEEIFFQTINNFNFDDTISATFHGMKYSNFYRVLFFILSLICSFLVYFLISVEYYSLSFGLVCILLTILIKLFTFLTTTKCSLKDATHLVVRNSFLQRDFIPIILEKIPENHFFSKDWEHLERFVSSPSVIKIIDYRYNRFVFDEEKKIFISTLEVIPNCLPPAKYNMSAWLGGEHIPTILRTILGSNLMTIVNDSMIILFFREMLRPSNMFQVVSFAIWCNEDYFIYALVILIMTLISALMTVIDISFNHEKIKKMTSLSSKCRISRRNGLVEEVLSSELLAGDLLFLDDSDPYIPCDAVITNGEALVDESLLTGETSPVNKDDIADQSYEDGVRIMNNGTVKDSAKSSILYAGTSLLRCRGRHGKPAMAIVIRTGFNTTKGSLVQSIMFPRPDNFAFYSDSVVFICIMSVIAFFGFIYSLIAAGAVVPRSEIIKRSLDIITVVIPPALTSTIAIGTAFSLKRLHKKKVFCICPSKINVSSNVDLICFDKTGTLTEDGLEIGGVLPVSTNYDEGDDAVVFVSSMTTNINSLQSNQENYSRLMLDAMVTCHSLRLINGKLMGDSLDLRMFTWTKWLLEEGGSDEIDIHSGAGGGGDAIVPTIVRPPEVVDGANFEMGTIRQFDFDAELRRMSVISKRMDYEVDEDGCISPIAEDNSDSLYIFCKGSPETLSDICKEESLPSNYNDTLAYYAHRGLRVIACAYRSCPDMSWLRAQKIDRSSVEKDLTFLGFIIFENKLKPASSSIIASLNQAEIPSLMCTGDNLFTAISVGRACGMIKQDSLVYYPTSYHNVKSTRHVQWKCVDDVEHLEFDPLNLEPHRLKSSIDFCVDDDNSYKDREEFVLAIDGDFFDWMRGHLDPLYSSEVFKKTVIYARMGPHHKQLLVECLQGETSNDVGKKQHTLSVAFCGDGANDCGGLKAADVGISLSHAEASVAAPFTSSVGDISCVISILMEGRASLVTSFCCFKYMTLYSMIQFFTLVLLYSLGTSIADYQFVYIDLILIIPLGILMSRYAPSKSLTSSRPTARLLSPVMLVSILGHIFLQAAFQFMVFFDISYPLLKNTGYNFGDKLPICNNASTSIFYFSCFLYIGTSGIFSVGRPYRQKSSGPFVFAMVALTILTLLMMIFQESLFSRLLQISPISPISNLKIVLYAALYMICAYLYDRVAIGRISNYIISLFNDF